ncbi:hypothetical protein OROMI_003485 [Orobanche minor]
MTPSPIVFFDPNFTDTNSIVPFTPVILSNGEYDPSIPFTIGPDSDLPVLGPTKLGSKIGVLGAVKLGSDNDVHEYDSGESIFFESEDDLVVQPSTKSKWPGSKAMLEFCYLGMFPSTTSTKWEPKGS